MSSASHFSFHSFDTGPTPAIRPVAPAHRGAEASAAAPAAGEQPFGALDPCDPDLPTPWRIVGSEPSWGPPASGGSHPSWPAPGDQVAVALAPGGTSVLGRPLTLQVPAPSAPAPTPPTRVPLPPALPLAVVEAPPRPAPDVAPHVSSAPSGPVPGPRHRKQRWQRWDVAVGTLVGLVVVYLLLAGVLYASRLWEARQTNSVTLWQDLGHGGMSQVTVVFENNHLLVSEIDNNDPQRVTILTVNEAIVLSTDKTVLEAWFQAVLLPSRLDLVLQLDGGLDWPPYHPQFTAILINNVAAVTKDPHAPGLRAPTASELQQALHKLGS